MNPRATLYSLIIVGVLAIAIVGTYRWWVPQNPPLNTAISAHGNTDWHIDTANEFLFGTDMGGNPTAANHAPDSWTKTHIHTGQTNTNHFYYDSDLTTPGDDADATNGIDRNMLFFYAGHGGPTSWSTLGNNAGQGDVRLGDGPQGLLRYYWQCSCEVFAHGPDNCTPSAEVYGCPEDFDGSSDSTTMRNVYERWGPALGSDLRMACGVSTLAWCHEYNVNNIWEDYNSGMDVADSFIDGLHTGTVAVPLCITTGGFSTASTPLYDEVFTNQRNKSGSYLHIQYLSGFDSNAPEIMIKEPPNLIPVFELIPLPHPDPWAKVEFIEKDGLKVSRETIKERGPKMQINPVSGALYIRGERKVNVSDTGKKEEDYVKQAMLHIREQGWDEKMAGQPYGSRMIIDTRPRREAAKQEVKHALKNVTVKVRRYLEIDGRKVPVYGPGGVISVQMNNDGSLLNARKVWRKIGATKRQAKVKPYEEAEAEAMKRLGENAQGYTLADWGWGFKEEAGNVEQKELRMIYRFDFRPKDRKDVLQYPPQLIEIDGLREG